jgi:hypothetical protein
MKIEIALNKKSIQQARKQLLYIKKILPEMQKDFLEDVAMWLIDRANLHLNNSDIGENVKIDIRNGWEYDFTENGIKITNNTEKAVFVEFGVGIVGQGQPHPEASAEGYRYNVPSRAKFGGYWSFSQKGLEELDLPKENVQYEQGRDGIVFLTQGAKGVWYAYNAIVDARMELAKSGGGEIGALWDKVKKRYIK